MVVTHEAFFTNLLFFLLFFTMILHAKFEIEPGPFELSNSAESPAQNSVSTKYASTKPSQNTFEFTRGSSLRGLMVFISTLILTFFLSYRWVKSGHPPLSNLYESLLFLTWTFLVFYLTLFFLETKVSEKGAYQLPFLNSLTRRLSEALVPTLGRAGSRTDALVLGRMRSNMLEGGPSFQPSRSDGVGYPNNHPKDTKILQNEESGNPTSFLSSQVTYFILISTSLFIYTFAHWRLPSEMQQISPLVPALQSNWLLMHVSIMILSYGSLLGGSLFSIAYLVIEKISRSNLSQMNGSVISDPTSLCSLLSKLFVARAPHPLALASKIDPLAFNGLPNDAKILEINTAPQKLNLSPTTSEAANEKFPNLSTSLGPDCELRSSPSHLATNNQAKTYDLILIKLDNLSSQTLSFAFPLLTLGILSGAVWANEAWGSYWSWDPKETWALITWFVFSIYLHVRINKGWSGTKAAWVGTIGFFVVWICYLGVNLLGKGLHSYGWWAN
jgi:cytochrome c-type biogenesis protein CcsB